MDRSSSPSSKSKLSAKGALSRSLFLTVLIGAVGTLFASLPDFDRIPITSLFTVWGLSIAIGVAGFWNALRSHWLAEFIMMFSLTTLFLASAFHTLGAYLPGSLWTVTLVGVYVLAWALPLLNVRLAKLLHDEQMRPRTWFGRNQILIFFLIVVSSTAIMGVLGQNSITNIHPVMLFIGVSSFILAVGFGQYFSYQLWKKW